jgi:magnesium-transporting ATPase (P-type)
MFELVNIYLIRSNYRTPFFSNKWLLISIIVTIVLQLLLHYVPFLSILFGIRGIDMLDWVYIVAVSGILVILYKSIQPQIDKLSPGES